MTVLQRPAPTEQSWWGGALWALGGLAAGSVLYAVDPNQPGHYPTCPFLATTGFYCPGCGSLRATHDLLHGDLAGALARNPLAVLVLPVLAWTAVSWVLRRTGRDVTTPTDLPAWVLWSFLALVVAYGVLRNLPGWTWLSPA